MRKCKIGIVGFGTVGSGIYKILSSEVDSHPILKEIEIAKIAVKDLNKKRDIELDNNLSKLVEKLKKSEDPKRKYEYILWLGKKLKEPDSEILVEENKVKGCVSEVFVKATIKAGKLFWEGYSDALITKGLLAFLISGLNELTPNEVVEIDKKFIEDTGLKASLTPSRSNGFLNILLKMQSQANEFL